MVEFNSEFWAAITGAVVGGVISLGIQLVALNAAKQERREERQERRVALSRSLMYKLMRITSDLHNLHQHVEESYAAAPSEAHGEPFLFVLPLANHPEYVHFSEQEVSLVMSFKDDDLLDQLMSLDVVHNGLIDVFKTYQIMRNELLEKMPAQMNGNVGTTTLNESEMLVVRPRMVAINILLEQARARAKGDYLDARSTLEKLHKAMTVKLGVFGKLQFKNEGTGAG
jgi:hypothetical protein